MGSTRHAGPRNPFSRTQKVLKISTSNLVHILTMLKEHKIPSLESVPIKGVQLFQFQLFQNKMFYNHWGTPMHG
jgi:hypothetical protein